MIYAITRWWREQREISRMMRDFRTGTARAALILIACAIAAFTLLLAFNGAFAEEHIPTTTMYVCTKEGPLNVRERAGLDAERVARLERGEAVQVVRVERGWALILGVSEGGEGWVSARYLSDRPILGAMTFTVEED